MVASKRVQPLAWLTFLHEDTTVTIEAFDFMPGSSASFRPTATHVSTGISIWSIAPMSDDAYDVTQQVALRHVIAGAHHFNSGLTACRHASAALISTSSFEVRVGSWNGYRNGRATVVLW